MAESAKPITGIKPPSAMSFEGDVVRNWKLFIQKWNNYVILTGLDEQIMNYQVALLLHTMGDEALQRYNGFAFTTTEDARTVGEIIQQFEEHVVGEVNIIYERYLFNKKKQDNESFDSFLTSLRVLIKTCKFCDTCVDSLLCDRIVLGITDMNVQEQLLRERNLSLTKCIDICRAAEYAKQKGKEVRPENVNKVGQRKFEEKYARTKKPEMKFNKKCKFCGKLHAFKKELCPAWNKTCAKCSRMNHFAKMCTNLKQEKIKKIHMIESDSDDEAYINCVGEKLRDVKCIMLLNNKKVTFQLDTGASCNILPKCFASGYEPTHKHLKMWNGSTIRPLGTHTEHVTNPKNGREYSIEFTIVEKEDSLPLLGLKTIQAMHLIQIHEEEFFRVHTVSIEEFDDVFEDKVGNLPGMVHLETDSEIVPNAMSVQRVPLAMRQRLKEELDRLEEKDVITKVTVPTLWTSNIVVVEKPNKTIRLCLNPLALNKALIRPRYVMPNLEEVLHKLRGAKIFSKLDLRNGYWHLVLEESSSMLTTFQTPFGRYRWLRLPFGLNVASEIFQMKMQQAFEDLPGLVNIADDVVIYGKSEEEHDKNLKIFLERCKQLGVKLNRKKLELRCQEISFMGHRISKEGVRPDPGKIEAIVELKEPSCKEELRIMKLSKHSLKFYTFNNFFTL